MPLSEKWSNRIRVCYREILSNGGAIWVDLTEAMSPNTVVNAVNQMEFKFGEAHIEKVASAIDLWGSVAENGRVIVIRINVPAGTLLVDRDAFVYAQTELAELVASGKIDIPEELATHRDLESQDAGKDNNQPQVDVPSDKDKTQSGPNSAQWNALLKFATEIGKDVYEGIKALITGEYTLVNTLGRVNLKAGDRICIWMANVDDQAEIFVDDELINAKSLNEPGGWDYTDRISKPGKHMIMLRLKNSGRFDYSIYAQICRASDYAKGGNHRPICILERQGTDDLGAGTRLWYLKLDVI